MRTESKINSRMDAVIIVRMTDEQKLKAQQAAAESGGTVSEMIRQLLNKKLKK